MIEKIKNQPWKYYGKQLKDIRVLGLLVFAVIALLVAWSSLSAIETNYNLQKQISQLEQENSIQKLANNNQNLRNAYYNSKEFLELAARRQFGKAAPGETLVIIPKNVALAHTAKLTSSNTQDKDTVKSSHYQRNFEAWMDFFAHRLNTAE